MVTFHDRLGKNGEALTILSVLAKHAGVQADPSVFEGTGVDPGRR
jgi:hypothetical protein